MDNPNCSGSGPHSINPQVRVLPHSDSPNHGNSIVCYNCYVNEMIFRHEENRRGVATPYHLPAWDTLKVYKPEEAHA